MARIRVAQKAHRESGTDGTHSFTVIRIRLLCFYALLGDVHSLCYSARQLSIPIWVRPLNLALCHSITLLLRPRAFFWLVAGFRVNSKENPHSQHSFRFVSFLPGSRRSSWTCDFEASGGRHGTNRTPSQHTS